MTTTSSHLIPRICAASLITILFTTTITPVAWGETPEERCQRETEAYNRLWKAAWIRSHPEEVEKGQQPPSPTPPYRCIGVNVPAPQVPAPQGTPGYIPPPGGTGGSIPGVGGSGQLPGVGSGGGIPGATGGAGGAISGSGGNSGVPEFLPESPNPLTAPTVTPNTTTNPYTYDYHKYWKNRDRSAPSIPASSGGMTGVGNSLTTATGNGINGQGGSLKATGNGIDGKGNSLNPKGQPSQSTSPVKDDNPITRWWRGITQKPQPSPQPRDETIDKAKERANLRTVLRWPINLVNLHQCATVPVVPSAGYPGPQRGRLSDAVDLGYRIRVNGKIYAVFGDSFASPYQIPGTRTSDGKPYINLSRRKDHEPFTIWEINGNGEPVRQARVSGAPAGRYLPGGTIDGGSKGDVLMLSPVNRLNAGPTPGVLYRMTPDGAGGLRLQQVNKAPLPVNTSAISGFITTSPTGEPMYYFVTTTFQRDYENGIVSWRAADITNPATWQWYDADHTQWVPYNPRGRVPTFIPGTGPLPGLKGAKYTVSEVYYRKLADGTVVLAYLEGNKIKLRFSKALSQQSVETLTRVTTPVATVLPASTQRDILHRASGVETIAWSPEITLHIVDTNGNPVLQPYGPIIEPSSTGIRDLKITISQWSNPSGSDNMLKAARYATYPLTLGSFINLAGLTCTASQS